METKEKKTTVRISLPNEVLFRAMLMAHEMDVTFNQFVNIALNKAVDDGWRPKGVGGKKATRRKNSTA